MLDDPRRWHRQRRAPSGLVAEASSAQVAVRDIVLPPSFVAWSLLADVLRDCTAATRLLVVRFDTRGLSSHESPPHDALVGGDVAPAAYVVDALARPDLVSVAVVDQPLTGAGLAVALHCDLRILSTQARFQVSAETLGALSRLVELTGHPRAVEVALTGRSLGAAEATDAGLATVAVPPIDLEPAVADLLSALLARPRDVMVEMKAALTSAGLGRRREQSVADELAALDRLGAAGGP